MAIGHIAITVHQRSKGHSVAAALAYRHGIDLRDIRSDKLHRFSARGRRDEIAATGFTHGATAPAWRLDAQSFADALETAETRANSCIARDVQCALPHELPEPDRIALAQTWADLIATRYDAPVAYAVHRPDRRADTRNHHLHVLLPTRSLDPDGSLGRKLRKLDDQSTGPTEIKDIRSLWQVHCNTALVNAGLAIRIDTGRTRPSDVPPTPKVGPAATQFERDAAAKSGTAPGASIAEIVVTETECATAAGAELRRHVITHQSDLAADAAEVVGVEINLLEDGQVQVVPAPRWWQRKHAPRAPRDPRQREASKRVRLARKALEQAPDIPARQAELAAAKDAQAALRVELREQQETRSRDIDRTAEDDPNADALKLPELAPPDANPLVPPAEMPEPAEAVLSASPLLPVDPPPQLVSPTLELPPPDFPTRPILDAEPPPVPLPKVDLPAPPPAFELLKTETTPVLSPSEIPEPPEAAWAVPALRLAEPPPRPIPPPFEPLPFDFPMPTILDTLPPSQPLPRLALPAPPPAAELPQPVPQTPIAVDPPTPPWKVQQPRRSDLFGRLLRKIRRWWPWAESPPEPEPAVVVVRQVPTPEPTIQPLRQVPVARPRIRPHKLPRSAFLEPVPDAVVLATAPRLRPAPEPLVRVRTRSFRRPHAAQPVQPPYPDALRTRRTPARAARQTISRSF